jgi:hypothetical protein
MARIRHPRWPAAPTVAPAQAAQWQPPTTNLPTAAAVEAAAAAAEAPPPPPEAEDTPPPHDEPEAQDTPDEETETDTPLPAEDAAPAAAASSGAASSGAAAPAPAVDVTDLVLSTVVTQAAPPQRLLDHGVTQHPANRRHRPATWQESLTEIDAVLRKDPLNMGAIRAFPRGGRNPTTDLRWLLVGYDVGQATWCA